MKAIYNQIVTVNFKWGGVGYVQRNKIKSRIKVFVKTLHGKRLTHKVTIDIMMPLEKVKERLYELEPDEMA